MRTLTFTVDSALLSELGEKLVESVHLALVELVKNSYDADSTEVTIRFAPAGQKGPRIDVGDNGTGMSVEDLEKFWMRIATTNKVESNRSPIFGRWKTGAKGIGRFCCRRLGTQLKLTSTAKVKGGHFQRTEMNFAWKDFVPGTDVDSVQCPGSVATLSSAVTGTILTISGAETDEWKPRGWDYLKRQLAVLVANRGTRRTGFKEDPGFNIRLEAPALEGRIIDLRQELMKGGWGTLSGRVAGDGEAKCELDAKGIGKKSMTFSKTYPGLKGISFQIGIITDRKDQLRDPRLFTKDTIRKVLPEWGGVQIRVNGFRVYPYGDDDWLFIDRDRGLRKGTPESEQLAAFAESLKGIDPRRALLPLLSMRSHVGSVEIQGNAPGFEMKASREGFISSQAVDDLRELVRNAIDWSTICRARYVAQRSKDQAADARVHLEEAMKRPITSENLVQTAVEYIDREVRNIAPLLPSRAVQQTFLKATDAILKRTDQSNEELRHLRLVASTSTLLLIFSHEVNALLGSLEAARGSLDLIEKKLSGKDATRVSEIRKGLLGAKTRFGDLLKMTSLVATDGRKTAPEKLAIHSRVQAAVQCFDLIKESYQIAIDIDHVPENVTAGPIQEAELLAVLLNALSNSIKSVIAADGPRKIAVEAGRSDGRCKICIRDTGLGLAPKYFEEVFTPFVADPGGKLYRKLKRNLNPQDQYVVGTGSGLGLSIAKEIVQARGGQIRFVSPTSGWNAELEVMLP